jgi:hypothetical protein
MKTHGNTDNAVSLKYGLELEMTYREIAVKLGVSYQYVQQTETVALKKFEKKFRIMFPDTWPIIQEEIERGKFGRDTMHLL